MDGGDGFAMSDNFIECVLGYFPIGFDCRLFAVGTLKIFGVLDDLGTK